MKKLFLLALIFIGALALSSCKKECERGNYGDVTVTNRAGATIMVDVTWGNSDYNHERTLGNGQSTTYYRVPAGSVRIWGHGGWGWQYNNIYLYACENYEYTWYAGKEAPADMVDFDDTFVVLEEGNFTSKSK